MLDPKKLFVGAGSVLVPGVASTEQRSAGYHYIRRMYQRGMGQTAMDNLLVGTYAAMVEAAPPPPISLEPLGVPEGYRLVRNVPGEMIQIDDLITWLTKVRDQFGNTCVYGRDICWGAVALNRSGDDNV